MISKSQTVASESLKLLNVTIYNESFSYSFHVLAYKVEKEQYNLTVVTRIMPLNDTNFFTTVVNIDPRDDKAVPAMDFVFLTNRTTLADHYRLIGDVLNEIRKKDETKWVWSKVRIELNELAKTVERDLAEYNVEGYSISAIADGYWDCWAQCMAQECTPIPGVPPTGLCALCWAALEVCLIFSGPQNPSCIAAAACFGVHSFACGYQCSQ
jgi:hypothetical protein